MNLHPHPHDPKHPDMSPEAIDERLREVGRLYKLGMALRNPTWVWRGNIIEAAHVEVPLSNQRLTNLLPSKRRD